MDKYLEKLTKSGICSHTSLLEPLDYVEDPKLVYEAVYSSHPDWNSRINAIKTANYPKVVDFEGRAWDLIPQFVKDKVSKQALEDISENCDTEKPVKTVSDEELSEIIEHENYWYQYAPYFQRDILEFDYNECIPNPTFELSDKTRTIINKFNSAKRDYDNARALRRNSDVKKAIYNGVVYKTSQLPMEIIKTEYEEQIKFAQIIDKSICEYAMSNVTDIKFIKEAYRRLFYAQNFLSSFDSLVIEQQNATINILNNSNSDTNIHQYATIRNSLEKFNKLLLKYGISNIDKELFELSAPENAINCVKEYNRYCHTMFDGDSISGKAINLVMNTCYWVRDVHVNMLSDAKMTVIDACLGRIENKSLS